jgi:hydroxyethylthiazole kinase
MRSTTHTDLVDETIALLDGLRARRPLVHCLTNQVVKAFTANTLLAIGAAPAMVEHPAEADEFAAMADALLVNVGTLDEAQMGAMRRAIPSANRAGKPWVLDPVAVGPLSLRTRFAREIVELRPAMVRGNASEILALAGQVGRGRGVESGDSPEAARDAARELAARTGAAVLVSGAVDFIVGEGREAGVANGHILMTRVTGVGCAMGAIAAACLPVAGSRFAAAVATAVLLGIAGDLAAERTQRPGSFQIALLDALDELDGAIVRRRARIVAP